MREYRRRNPDIRDRGARSRRAYQAALRALRDVHPQEFEEFLTIWRAREGLPPIGSTKPGPKRKAAA